MTAESADPQSRSSRSPAAQSEPAQAHAAPSEATHPAHPHFSDSLTRATLRAAVEAQFKEAKPLAAKFGEGSRLHVDRPLPFVCVYAQPDDADDLGTEQLIFGEAVHLVVKAGRTNRKLARELVSELLTLMQTHFGGCLLVEVWASGPANETSPLRFRLVEGGTPKARLTADAFESALATVRLSGRKVQVQALPRLSLLSATHRPLMLPREVAARGGSWLGVEVSPIYRTEDGEQIFPALLRQLRTRFARSLRHAAFAFIKAQTTHPARSVLSLGPRALVRSVWQADAKLAELTGSFDFLLAINPFNSQGAWNAFRKSRYERAPELRYRPLPIDPVLLKRELYKVPLERIEDPVVANLFLERQAELERQLTMLTDRGTHRFVLMSQQLYGPCTPELVRAAEDILERVPNNARTGSGGGTVDAVQFCRFAEAELGAYRDQASGFAGTVVLLDDFPAGMMASQGKLLVSRHHRCTASRVDALLQHEVGTHLVTYYNGKAQRLQQLSTGLAGYDELQEGLAVLAEFLAGGMTPPRLRVLAARVLAVDALLRGGSFVEVFRLLCRYGFSRRTAFSVVLRVFRGGGLTKDMIYLRGLISLLGYLREGGELAPLFLGKVALAHLPIIHELQSRGVIVPAPFLPRYLQRPAVKSRLERVRQGIALPALAGVS